MVELTSLWLPILLSSVFVFLLSSVIHMALPWHKKDFPKLERQDEIQQALRPFNIPAGEYLIPRAADRKEMMSPEYKEKMEKGPMAIITVWTSAQASMSTPLILWFIYTIVIGIFAAYVSGRALPTGAHYLAVFRFAGVTTFLAYTAALWQMSIWFKRPWSTTIKSTIDGLLYALLTAGTFGWLWPQ